MLENRPERCVGHLSLDAGGWSFRAKHDGPPGYRDMDVDCVPLAATAPGVSTPKSR
jgi:hypothetical protein